MAKVKGKKVVKKRIVKVEADGRAYIQASFNNIIVTMTNAGGQVISWGSAGKAGFRGSKKKYTLCCTGSRTRCRLGCP